MKQRIFVVPKKGLRVVDPQSGQELPPEGAEVLSTSYWSRRERDGDVTFGKPAKAATRAPSAPAATETKAAPASVASATINSKE